MSAKVVVERTKYYWEQATRPSATLTDDHARQVASVTAGMLAALLLTAAIILPLWLLTVPKYAFAPVVSLGVFVTLLIGYVSSRTKYYWFGTGLLLLSMPILVVIVLLTATGPIHERLLILNALFITILIVSIIYSIRITIISSVLCLVFIASILVALQVSINTAFSYLVMTAVLAALIVASAATRKYYAHRLFQSQQQLDAFFAQSLDGVYFMMLDVPLRWKHASNKETALEHAFVHQRVTRANDAVLAQFGKSREQFFGMTPNDLFAHDLAQGKTLWRQLFDEGHLRTEIELRKADGTPMWVEIDNVCFYDSEGRIKGHFGVQRDVTKRKQAEHELRVAEVRYHALFEQSHDAVFILTLDGRYMMTNTRASVMFGYSKEEMQGLSVNDITVEPEKSDEVHGRLMRGEHVPTFQRLFRKKNGDILPVEINVEVVRDTNGEPMHIQSVVRDITERKQTEEALRATEARQRALLQAIPDLMFRIRRDGTYLDYHAANPAHLAAPPDEFMGRTTYEVLPHDIAAFQMRLIERVLRTGEEAAYEYVLPIGERSMNFEARMVKCAPDEVMTIVRDVTERKKVEAALKQSEMRFSSAFRNSPVPMVISTSQGIDSVYIEANQAYLDMVGFTWEELAGRNLTEIGVAIPNQRRKERIDLLYSAGRYQTQEAQIRNRVGDLIDIIIWAERIEYGDQRYDLEIILDVTERRKLQEQQFALAIEKERVKVLNRFVQNSSHEFRTPLAVINTNLYLIDKIDTRDVQHRYVEQAKQQIKRIEQLLVTMQTMTDLDTGASFNYGTVNINELVEEIANDIQLELQVKTLSLEIGLSPSLSLVRADRHWLKVALEQLVNNALRFTMANGKIGLHTASRGRNVTIEVCDTGIGIDKQLLNDIFKRFWRQDEAHTTPGFGLGLPMAQAIVERHAGTLEVESEVGAGSTFRIVLPINA